MKLRYYISYSNLLTSIRSVVSIRKLKRVKKLEKKRKKFINHLMKNSWGEKKMCKIWVWRPNLANVGYERDERNSRNFNTPKYEHIWSKERNIKTIESISGYFLMPKFVKLFLYYYNFFQMLFNFVLKLKNIFWTFK